MLYCPNFFCNVLQVWMTGKDVYLQMTWSWPDKTWNILCSYCLQWNTSQSKFRNHYFLFLFAFSILSQLFLIWGCTSGTAGHGGGSDWLGDWTGDRTVPSPLSVVPAGPVQPSFVSGSLIQPWGGSRFSSARSLKTAVVWQPLCSPSAPYLYGASPTGLPSSSVAGAGVSLTSASKARTPPRPVDPAAPLRLHRHPSIHQLHRAPSSLRLRLGRASTRHCLGTPLLWLRLVAASHRLCWLSFSASGSSTTCSSAAVFPQLSCV